MPDRPMAFERRRARRLPLRVVFPLVVLVAVLGGTCSAAGDVVRLNAPLVLGGRVSSFAVSPDGSRVVYRADQDTDNVIELYSVPTGGGAATKISGHLSGGNVSSFTVSPDGSRVVYLADADIAGVNELYSVPIAGGAVTKLNNPLSAGRAVTSFRFTPDGQRVVYLADQDTNDVFELFSVATGGSAVTKLNPSLPATRSVTVFDISRDSSRVIYSADHDTQSVFELYSVAVSGGGFVKLNVSLAGGRALSTFNATAIGGRVIYAVDPHPGVVGLTVELYSVPVGGGASVLFSADVIPPGTLLFLATFTMSPDGARVLYRTTAGGVTSLISAAADVSSAVRIDNPALSGNDVEGFYVVSPNSSRAVYSTPTALFSVPITGGAVTKITPPLVAGGGFSLNGFTISPDSQRVVYRADQDKDGVVELYSVPILGGAGAKLNGPLVNGGNVATVVISPDSQRVAYRADQDTDGVTELYSAPIAGGGAIKLNPPLVSGGAVSNSVAIATGSQRVVYLADQDTNDVQEAYSASPFSAATTVVAAVLPGSRAVQVGTVATIFGTIVNAGSHEGQQCGIAMGPTVGAGPLAADFSYQTTDPLTNALTGSPNTPVSIPPGLGQSYVLQIKPTAVTPPVDVTFVFQCANSEPAAVFVGLNTLLLSASIIAGPDIIALGATLTGDGIANIPGPNGTGVFAVATSNVGAGDVINITADTGAGLSAAALGAGGPSIALSLCQTNPLTGACVNPTVPASSVTATIAVGATPTFSVFIQGLGTAVPFDPAHNRVFVRFKDQGGAVRGATSVAVRTQ